jgi:hypothetical protein
MGDRANIRFVYSDGRDIFFYTHWDGYDLPVILRNALVRGEGRWSDESYLARIIFSEMIQGDILSETGYGIDVHPAGDAQYPLITVFSATQEVEGRDGRRYTFSEYTGLEN